MKKSTKSLLALLTVLTLTSCSNIDEKDVETAAEYEVQMDEFDKDHEEGTLNYDEMNAVIEEKNAFEKELKEKYPSDDEKKELKDAVEKKIIELKNK